MKSGMKAKEKRADYLAIPDAENVGWVRPQAVTHQARTTSLRPLGEVVKPTRPRVKPSDKPHLPFIGMEHIEAHTMRLLGTVPASTMKSSAVHFQPGDVLYGRLRPYLNKVYRPEFEGLCSAEFIVFPKADDLDTRYLQYFLNSSAFVSYASHLNAGDRPRVDFEQLAPYPFPAAPLDQQKLIVAEIEKQFSRLDEAVVSLTRAKANLKRYKAAVLKAAVEGKLTEAWRKQHPDTEAGSELLHRILAERRSRWEQAELAKMQAKDKPPKDDTWKKKYPEPAAPDTTSLPELPEGWVWASVEQLGAIGEQAVMTGPFGSNIGRADFQDTGVPVLTIGCLREEGLSLDKAVYVSEGKAEELDRYKLKQGDMLFSRMASVGRAGFVTAIFEGALFNYHLMRLRLANNVTEPRYFVYYVRGAKYVRDYVREVNHGATRDGINTEQLLALPVALPPIREQEAVIAEVERRLSLADEAEDQVDANLQRADRLRQSILKTAFSNKMVERI